MVGDKTDRELFQKRKGIACPQKVSAAGGYTLLEVMMALAVGLIAMSAIYSVYASQMKAHRNRELSLELQQNLRATVVIVEQEIRAAGFDPEDCGRFGIVDVRRYDLEGTGLNPDGQPALFYTLDRDENGDLDGRNRNRNKEHCNFRIRQDNKTGRRYLAWDNGGGRQPLSENIHAIGFAYGIDADQDGRLDTWGGGTHPIWAVDTDNDNLLDAHIDANNDGAVDVSDDINQDGRIGQGDGGTIDPPVPLDRIKAVRVWLLAQSACQIQGYSDTRTHVVGDQVILPANDGFLRRVLETTIDARNL